LGAIRARALDDWEHAIPADLAYEAVMDRYAGAAEDRVTGRLIAGDNLRVAKTLLAAIRAGTLDAPDLIYMDPPFFTRAEYRQTLRLRAPDGAVFDVPASAFSDTWSAPDRAGDEDFARYLAMLTARVAAARDLLADTGSLWIHLDHHAAHYAKVLADAIFGGPEYMINEVIWQYKSGGSSKRRFSRKHDTLLFYAKNPKRYKFSPMREQSYNRERKPYRFKGVKEYEDEGGWYTLVNMKDVWALDMVGRTSKERTGYATQKPETLIARVVETCTEPGALCFDLFGGSGTLAAVCSDRGRRWMLCDSSGLAALHAERRMVGKGAAFEVIDGRTDVAGNGASSGAPEWTMNARLEKDPEGGGITLTIEPVSYRLPDGFLSGLRLSDGEDVAALLASVERNDPGQLLAGLCVDTDADGAVFRPCHASYGGGVFSARVAETVGHRVTVRALDVFGNTSTQTIAVTQVPNQRLNQNGRNPNQLQGESGL
jgi:DNA modification methylase